MVRMDDRAMEVHKVLIAGPVGVGKTTAVRAASDSPILTTDVQPTDDTRFEKDTTTVAMDFSVVWLDDHLKVHLYGTPGQERFDFMWSVLSKGTASTILLADHSNPDVLSDLEVYLDAFKPMIEKKRMVLGVTRIQSSDDHALQYYRDIFTERRMSVPVLEADPRSRHDIIVLIRASLAITQIGHPV